MASASGKAAAKVVVTRDVAPIVKRFRDFLTGRPVKNPLRFPHEMSERPGPEPNLPEGPSHKLSSNYYYTRDGRREVQPNTVIADNAAPKSIEAGGGSAVAAAEATAATPTPAKGRTPGAVYNYSSCD